MRRSHCQSRWVAVALLFFLSIGGCAVERGKVYTVDGQRYCVASGIWRNKWWQHYERGVSCAAGKFWDEAIASFKAALAIQRGQQDRWRANTYGVHFIDDYFPHRELGIVYYRLQRYGEAEHELEQSLRTVETAKAKFYLNKTRKALLLQTQSDTASPRIVLHGPSDGLLTNEVTVTVQGRAEDDTYVAALAINGRDLFVELAEHSLPFTRTVPLRDGANAIDIVAVDLLGRQTRQHVTVHLDRYGPLVSFERVELHGVLPQRRARVQGFLSDHNQLKRFVLSGRHVSLRPGMAGDFHEEIPIAPDTRSLHFEAEDTAGNVTRGDIALAPPAGRPPGTREGKSIFPGLPRWASLHPGTVVADLVMSSSLPPRIASAPGREEAAPVIELTSRDLAGGGGRCRTKGKAIVFDNTIYLEGKVTDDSEITAFSIEGESLLRRPGRQLFFAYIAQLRLHRDNGFLLEAVDTWGNATRCEIIVTHTVQQARQIGSRLRVLLEPFKRECAPGALAATVYDQLFGALIARGRFYMIRAEKEAEGLLEGTACEMDTAERPQSLHVTARYLEADTGAYVLSEDVYGEDVAYPDGAKVLMDGLALKLQRHFPLEEGEVTKRNGKQLRTSLSKTNQIRPRMKLIVFREEEAHRPQELAPVHHEILGEARITKVSEDFSEATLLTSGSPADVQERDKVITK